MKTVNQLVEKLYKEAKHKMISKQKSDTAAYKELLKNLIVQVFPTQNLIKENRVSLNSWRLKYMLDAERVI